jgi:long-chain acyl-CoA synthetase
MSKILEIIKFKSQKTPSKIALSDGKVLDISYHILDKEIAMICDFLKSRKFTSVALLADNSPSWIAFDLACLKAKVTFTPIPHFFTKDQVENLIKESAVEMVFSDKIFPIFLQKESDEKLQIFNRQFSLFEIEKISPKKFHPQTAKITFTSGSTGNPKGVCLSQNQIENVVFSLAKKLGDIDLESNLSLLPLSVLLENIAGVYCSLMLASKAIIPSLSNLGFSGSSTLDVTKFAENLHYLKPQSLILVPELAKLLIALVAQRKIGEFNFKFIAVGGAKIAPDLLEQAKNLGLPLYQGYGLSEFSSVVALSKNGENKLLSVGKILPHIAVKISPEKEILLKGNIALGYSDGKSLDLDEDGFYRSGDIGHIDEDGFLYIDGRKKNIFITSFGRNVNPEWLESELLKSPLIFQACVFGEALPHNVAIVTTTSNQEMMVSEVAKINENLPDYAKIGKIILSQEPFSTKNNMLTGNGRIRRDEIFKFYQNQIN